MQEVLLHFLPSLMLALSLGLLFDLHGRCAYVAEQQRHGRHVALYGWWWLGRAPARSLDKCGDVHVDYSGGADIGQTGRQERGRK